jgi:hypothetical protein
MDTDYLILYWLLFVLIVAGVHLYLIKRKKVSPDKSFWLWLRLILAFLFILTEYFFTDHSMPVVFLAYLFSGWFLHDFICALGMGRDPWYLNNSGPIDRFQHAAGGSTTWFVFKAIGCLTTVAMYFLNE